MSAGDRVEDDRAPTRRWPDRTGRRPSAHDPADLDFVPGRV